MKIWPWVMLLPLVALVASCASRKPEVGISEGQCLGWADALKTLKVGDPLPRVKEVIGTPSREYRTTTTYGGRYDVLEYYTGNTPCARFVLDAPHRLVLLFDEKGQFIGHGEQRFMPIRGATSNRVRGW